MNSNPKWSLEPLNGKYYGTLIKGPGIALEIWGHRTDGKPSEREKATWGEYDPEGSLYGSEREWYGENMSDSHYETEGEYKLASFIVDKLNEHDFDATEH